MHKSTLGAGTSPPPFSLLSIIFGHCRRSQYAHSISNGCCDENNKSRREECCVELYMHGVHLLLVFREKDLLPHIA
jgi:hypothetical protein